MDNKKIVRAEIRERQKTILLLVLFFGTLALGVLGLAFGDDILNGFFKGNDNVIINALFDSFEMFTLNYTELPTNVLVNIARYLAALFAIDALLIVFKDGFSNIKDILKGFRKKTIYVLGDTDQAEEFCNYPEHTYIQGRTRFFYAKTYVLLGSDEENKDFYQKYYPLLKNRKVFIRTNDFQRVITNNGLHTFFSIEEMAARKYWLNNSLLSIAYDEENKIKPELNIAIVGFNALGEELVYQALQTNIFDAGQVINYHIFGDVTEFEHLHVHLDTLHVIVHHEEWYEALDLLNSADRILISADDSMSVLEKMLYRVICTPIDVLCPYSNLESSILDHRAGLVHSNVRLFDIAHGICTPEMVLNEADIIAAKELNFSWSGESDRSRIEELWLGLSAEKRYSNVSCVDYHVIRKLLLEKWNAGQDIPWTNYEEKLAELEHIRWSNYYLYANWDKPSDLSLLDPGKNKSEARRLHEDLLIDYNDLPEPEKEKDRVQVRKLFELGM